MHTFNKKIIAVHILASLFTMAVGTVLAQAPTTGSDTVVINTTDNLPGVIISGTITDDATKRPAIGIRVQVENFSAAITDNKGNFSLKVPSYNSTVLVEGEGYDSRRIPLKGRKKLNVALLDDGYDSYHEPVTMPFGTQTKKYVPSSVGQYNVNGWQQPAETVDAMLQGRVAGLNSIRRSGLQGAGANMFLRGYNSLYATNKPLIIVDGMLFDYNEYGESIISNNYTNPLSLIDAKDIDNITVLKDASSIYGTKGANGAIIITTAKAKSQATHIDFAAFTGFNRAPSDLPVMNAGQYRTYLAEMLQSKGMTPGEITAQPYMNDDPNNPGYASYHNNTDWQERVFQNSSNQNYYLKVTGGDNIATYGLTVGFLQNNGIVRQTDLTRYNTRFNADFNFTKRFTGFANLSFTYNSQNLKDQGIANKTAPVFNALVKAPFLTDREVNDKGVVSPNLADRDTLGFSNPSVLIDGMQAYNRFYRFFGTFGFKYDIGKYVSASTVIGVQFDKLRENFFVPRKGVVEDTLANAVAESRMGSQVKRLFTIFNDTRLEYKLDFSRVHNVAARVGIRYQNNQAEQDFALGFNSATDDLVSVQNGVAALRQIGGGVGDWNWMNIYAGVDYGFKEKFFINLSAAMDGSSRFGKEAENGLRLNGSRFPVLPSVSAAWLLSSENFMAGSAINLLKLRGTFGLSGNDDIGNYTARKSYGSQNLLGAQGLVRTGIPNPSLEWETTRKIDLGLDVSFWNERVFVSLDAYCNTTNNMLVYQPLLSVTGFNTVLTNGGKMQNMGFEASANMRVINNVNFKWDLGANIAFNKNEILAVPDNNIYTEFAGATIVTQTGAEANQFFGYKTNGVFVSDAEAASAGLMKKNANGSLSAFKGGDVRFNDLNGDKIIDDNDRTVIGAASPTFTGGITNRVYWKRFELNALLTFSRGGDVYNYVRHRLEATTSFENQLASVDNRWRANGQVTNMPKATWADPMGNSRFSDRWIEDGSYLRLRSLSVQYSLPISGNNFLKSAAIYASGNNLLTFTNYLGYDPEFSANATVFAQGIDTGLDPIFRSMTLGVRIGL